MNIQVIHFDGIEIPVHDFLDNQRTFLTDVNILCWGINNIMEHEKLCSDVFLAKINQLHNKIYQRHEIIRNISDNISWKQEICLGLSALLIKMTHMKNKCIDMRNGWKK